MLGSELDPDAQGIRTRVELFAHDAGDLGDVFARIDAPVALVTDPPYDDPQALATFLGQAAQADGQALLLRKSLDQGEIYFCTTLPRLAWSEMGDGLVVVPMLQRLLAAGSQRLQRDSVAECGQVGASDLQLDWRSAETGQLGNVQTQAGVYKNGDRWLVVNRPAAEDKFKRVEDSAVAGLFGTLSFQQYSAVAVWAKRDDTALQGEIWRLILFLMLLALLVEAWLIRPASVPEAVPPKPQPAAA
ncbi:MAG: hypothetical protein VX509_06645 [Verrucomicrobiota bacterium]|nr:hypothetical protein [Verrucomicrobiota bacterium]